MKPRLVPYLFLACHHTSCGPPHPRPSPRPPTPAMDAFPSVLLIMVLVLHASTGAHSCSRAAGAERHLAAAVAAEASAHARDLPAPPTAPGEPTVRTCATPHVRRCCSKSSPQIQQIALGVPQLHLVLGAVREQAAGGLASQLPAASRNTAAGPRQSRASQPAASGRWAHLPAATAVAGQMPCGR